MQTMLHFLENDREKLLHAVTTARTPEKTQDAVIAELDRLLYQYNEQDASDRLKESAASMIQTARHMVPLLTGYGDVRVWERTVGEESKGAKGKKLWFWVFLIVGLGCFAATFLLFQMAGISFAMRDALIPLGLLVLSLAALFLSGLFLAKSRSVTVEKKTELQTEITMDGESIYQALHTAVLVMDKNLDDIRSSSEWEARKKETAGDAPVLASEEADLYGGLLEAWYTNDGDVALDRLADLKYYLHKKGIDCVDYSPEHASWFDMMPSFKEGTLRPALIKDGTLLKKGLASGGD